MLQMTGSIASGSQQEGLFQELTDVARHPRVFDDIGFFRVAIRGMADDDGQDRETFVGDS
jgi:hypothetical protein